MEDQMGSRMRTPGWIVCEDDFGGEFLVNLAHVSHIVCRPDGSARIVLAGNDPEDTDARRIYAALPFADLRQDLAGEVSQ